MDFLTQITHYIHTALNAVFIALMFPFRSLHPIWAMIWISALTGVLMVWIFGLVSDQDAVKRVKDRISGSLLGVRLFKDDLGVTMRLQGRLLGLTLRYMKLSFVPMLIMMGPVILIIIQLNHWFGYRPVEPGKATVVNALAADYEAFAQDWRLVASDGVTIEQPIHIPSKREVSWRVRADEPGEYTLSVQGGDEEFAKQLRVGDGWGPMAELRSASFVDVLLYPGETPLPLSGSLQRIEANYREGEMPVFGYNIHWLVWFFALSIAFGFAVKGKMGVQV